MLCSTRLDDSLSTPAPPAHSRHSGDSSKTNASSPAHHPAPPPSWSSASKPSLPGRQGGCTQSSVERSTSSSPFRRSLGISRSDILKRLNSQRERRKPQHSPSPRQQSLSPLAPSSSPPEVDESNSYVRLLEEAVDGRKDQLRLLKQKRQRVSDGVRRDIHAHNASPDYLPRSCVSVDRWPRYRCC